MLNQGISCTNQTIIFQYIVSYQLCYISRHWKINQPKTGHSRKMSTPHIILLNLALSLMLFHITFLVGIKQTGRDYLCRSFSALTLYFLLVSFGWMLVEGVYMYIKILNHSICTVLRQNSESFQLHCTARSRLKLLHMIIYYNFVKKKKKKKLWFSFTF